MKRKIIITLGVIITLSLIVFLSVQMKGNLTQGRLSLRSSDQLTRPFEELTLDINMCISIAHANKQIKEFGSTTMFIDKSKISPCSKTYPLTWNFESATKERCERYALWQEMGTLIQNLGDKIKAIDAVGSCFAAGLNPSSLQYP